MVSVSRDLPDDRFFSLLLKSYFLSTLGSAIVLHVAVSLIAPGDGGTALALGNGVIAIVLTVMIAVLGAMVFPIAAAASWPFRGLVEGQAPVAFAVAAIVGAGAGYCVTLLGWSVGPGDFWSGILVGCVFGCTWFLVVNTARQSAAALVQGKDVG